MNAKALTGRMMTPSEVADVYEYFITRSPAGETGTVVLADGGITFLR